MHGIFNRGKRSALVIGVALLLTGVTHSLAWGECDLKICVTSFTVTSNDAESYPDPFFVFRVDDPEPGYGNDFTRWGTSEADDQPVGSHPFVGNCYWITHVRPIAIKVWVYDWDLVYDDLMAEGEASLFNQLLSCPGAATVVQVQVTGPSATATLEVSAFPTGCTKNKDYASRDLPYSPGTSATAAVSLRMHLDETGTSPESVQVIETIPSGFQFVSAVPPPASVVSITDNEGRAFTRVRWNFTSPPTGSTMINYSVITPDSSDALCGRFSGYIVVDGVKEEVGVFDNEHTLEGAACESIPSLTEWGAIIFGALLLLSLVLYTWRRRRTATA